MSQSLRQQSLLVAIAATLFFVQLGATHLWDVDEAIFSQAAKEMYQRGDAVVPYFNGEVFTHKPAMMYWWMMAAYELFGPTEFAARFWSAVFSIGSVLLTYRLGRLLFSPAAGFWSALALASSINFVVIARAATPDAYLVFFSTLAILFFVAGSARARAASGELTERNAPWAGQTRFRPSWASYVAIYAAMACGFLTKGPIGLVLPTAVIGLFLLVMGRQASPTTIASTESTPAWRQRLSQLARWSWTVVYPPYVARTIWSMRPLTALAVVAVVAGPWYALVGMKTDGEWLIGFFGVHNFGRFLSPMDNHRGPIVYYLIAISVGFFPWSVLFGPSLIDMRRQFAQHAPARPGLVLVCCWLAVWVGFFSLASTKLPSYVLPAYPALALFTGLFVTHWLGDPAMVSKLWSRLVWGTVLLAGVAIAVAIPIVSTHLLDGDWTLALIGVIPVAAAVVGLVASQRGSAQGAVATLATMSIVLALAMFAWGAPYIDRYQDSPRFAQVIAKESNKDQPAAICSYRYFRPSFVFYTDNPVAECPSVEAVKDFFAVHPGAAFIFTTNEQYDTLAGTLPPDVEILDRRPRFLGHGQILLLGRKASEATAAGSNGARTR